MDENLIKAVSTSLMLSYIFATMEMKALGENVPQEETIKVFNHLAETFIKGMEASGFRVVPKENVSIPEAFKNM